MKITIDGLDVFIDEEDKDIIEDRKWRARKFGNNKYYLIHNYCIKKKVYAELFHRTIMSAPKGYDIDHINGNTLDNRKENLRICTRSENICNVGKRVNNKSGYKCVSWMPDGCKWRAKIVLDYKQYFLGDFEDKEDAYKAYKEAATRLHKEFAHF